MIPYGRQDISEADIAAVVEVLRSDFLTQGPAVGRFEDSMRKAVGVGHAVAVNSATSALHIACLALGVGPGSRVWTSPITFVASANCALYCGAAVDFVDVDPRTYNMSVTALAAKLEIADREGRLPQVVIPVHLAGQSCDMATIADLGRRYGFRIIEDASHAVGASYRDHPVGDCRYSDISVFSFHPVKIVTSAEGGAALTNDDALAAAMCLLRSHGIVRDEGRLGQAYEGPWAYQQLTLGLNYRMTDVHAALGQSQMGRLEAFVGTRRAVAAFYDTAFQGEDLRRPHQCPETASSWHLYIIHVGTAERRLNVFNQLIAQGIGVNVHYIPVYKQPFYRNLGFAPDYCPAAEEYYRGAISIPLFAQISEEQRHRVVDAVRAAVRE